MPYQYIIQMSWTSQLNKHKQWHSLDKTEIQRDGGCTAEICGAVAKVPEFGIYYLKLIARGEHLNCVPVHAVYLERDAETRHRNSVHGWPHTSHGETCLRQTRACFGLKLQFDAQFYMLWWFLGFEVTPGLSEGDVDCGRCNKIQVSFL